MRERKMAQLKDLLVNGSSRLVGTLYADGGIALNSSTAQSTPQYILGIKAFADGGNIIWQSKDDVTVGSANKLATARTLTIGSASKTFNGSANVSWTLAEIGAAAASHTHSYLPLTGGTLSGDLTVGSATISKSGTFSGNAATATKLAAAKTLTIGSSGKTFDGSADVSWTLAEIGAGNTNRIVVQNTSVATSAWASNSTYSDYPYRAAIAITGVTANHFPEVVFSCSDATGGNYAPVVESYAGGVYIWAKEKPSAAITIPTIECRATA